MTKDGSLKILFICLYAKFIYLVLENKGYFVNIQINDCHPSPDCNENPAMERRNEVNPRNEEL